MSGSVDVLSPNQQRGKQLSFSFQGLVMDVSDCCFGPEQLSEAAFSPQPEPSVISFFGEMK